MNGVYMSNVFNELDNMLSQIDNKYAANEIDFETYYAWIEEFYKLYGVEDMN